MADGISLDWGSLAPSYQNPVNSFMQGYLASHTIAKNRHVDEARQDAIANPNDLNAMLKMAVYDPEGAKGIYTAQANDRAAQFRNVAGQLYSSYAQPTAQMPAQAPAAASQGGNAFLPPAAPGSSFDAAFAPVGAPGTPFGQGQQQPAQQGLDPQQAQHVVSAASITNPASPAMQQVGAMAMQGGNVNPAQLWAQAAQIDPQGTSQLIQSISNLDKLRLDRLSDANEAIGSAAQTLLSVPQSQRAAMLTQMAPQLAQHGITTDQINQVLQGGLTDQQLHGFIGQAIGTKGMLDQANKDRSFGLDVAKFNEDVRHNQVEEHKGLQDGFGNIVDPTSGKIIYSQGGGGPITFDKILGIESGGRQFTDGKTTTSPKGALGIAQIMPSTGPEAARLAGLPWDENKFRNDASYNRALGEAYYNSLVQRFGGDTQKAAAAYNAGAGAVDKAVNKYGDNWIQGVPAETQNYVRKLSGGVGANGGGAGGLTDDAIQQAAEWAIANGGKVPAGYARNKAAQAAIQNRVASIANAKGMTVQQIIQGGQDIHSAGKVLDSFTSGKDAQTVQALNNVTMHLATLGNLTDALGNGDVRAFNSIANRWAAATGKTAPTNFDAVKQIVGGEIVKVIAGAGGGQGDREQASAWINSANSPQQLKGAIANVKDLIGSQLHTLQNKYEAGTGRNDFARFLTPDVRRAWGVGAGSNHPADISAIMQKYGVR